MNIYNGKNRYIHIVLGDSAYGCLKEYFKKNRENKYVGQIINFKEDFSIGNIFGLDDNVEIRYKWLKKIFSVQSKITEESLLNLKEDVIFTYNSKLSIDEGARIIIWHGKNTNEQIALAYLVNRYEKNKVYEVDVTKATLNNDISNNRYVIRAVAECDIDEINIALNNIALITRERKQSLINKWKMLSNTKSTLRILKDDEIITVDEDYYDELILNNITEEFIKAVRVVGNVMGTSEQLVGDTFLLYRLAKLIESDLIEYKGDLWHFGTLYIRKRVSTEKL